MADYFDEEDEDAKADELPSDEEGDAMTGKSNNNNNNLSQPQSNPNRKPKTPPPVLDQFGHINDLIDMQQPVQLQQEVSSPQSLHSATSFSPRSQNSATTPKIFYEDTTNIMAFNPNSMDMSMPQTRQKHAPSKTMPVSMPTFWTCQMCTFAENDINSPVCGVCGALPPMDNKKKVKKKKKKKKKEKPLSARANNQIQQQAKNNKSNHGQSQTFFAVPVPQIPPQQQQQQQPQQQLYNPLSPRAYQPNHHQHGIWQQQQTRQRHNNHQQNHYRTVSAQIPQKSLLPSNSDLPNFLEEDEDEKDSQPSLVKIYIYIYIQICEYAFIITQVI